MCLITHVGIRTIPAFFKGPERTSEDKIFPWRYRWGKRSAHVPLWRIVYDFWVYPFILFNFVDHYIRKLGWAVPTTENHQSVLARHYCCRMSSSRLRRVSLWVQLQPLVRFHVQSVDVIEWLSRVICTSMTTKYIHFVLVVSSCVEGAWVWSSNLRLCILRRLSWFLILVRWLLPLPGVCLLYFYRRCKLNKTYLS